MLSFSAKLSIDNSVDIVKADTNDIANYFLEQFDVLINIINIISPPKIYHAMPCLAVHGDYHPGYLKYKDGKVTGGFDFGWSEINARCFDVGHAIMHFCTNWGIIND